MSIFAKKSDSKPQSEAKQDLSIDIDVDRTAPGGAGTSSTYGIADAIRLMRSLPTDQNIDLVVRVVRVTLGSVNVRIEDIVDDATRRQKAIQDNIAALHERVADLEGQLEARRRDIASQEADFKETTSVKERLLLAEKAAGSSAALRITPPAGAQTHTLDNLQLGAQLPPPSLPPPRTPPALPKPSPRD